MSTEEKQTELTVVEVLQPELNEVVKSSKMALNKAELYAIGYAPLMNEITEQNNIIKSLDKTNPNDAAKAKRASLDLGKILSRAGDKKKADKEVLLIETKHIDNLFNLLESTGRLGQADAKEIFTYAENIENQRLEKVKSDRVALLLPYGEVNQYIDLKAMDDTAFNNLLADTKLAHETRRENERLAELKRLEDEKKAEQERIEAEKKAEEARLKKEQEDKAEQERIKAENEKLRLEKEAKEKELAKEREANELKNKRAKELAPFINYIRDYDKLINSSEAEFQKEIDEMCKAFLLQQKYEADKLEEDRQFHAAKDAEISKLKAEKEAEIQRNEKELADEKARIEAEEAEKLAKEKAALLAPDKEKINALYVQIRDFKFPEVTTDEANKIISDVKESFAFLLTAIKEQAKSLK